MPSSFFFWFSFLLHSACFPPILFFFLFLPFFLPSSLPCFIFSVLSIFLAFFLNSSFPYFLYSLLHLFLASSFPSFLSSSLPFFLLTFLPSFLPSSFNFYPTFLLTYLILLTLQCSFYYKVLVFLVWMQLAERRLSFALTQTNMSMKSLINVLTRYQR